MRAFAELIMRGRMQAAFAATLATASMIFAWLGAAIVALVVLRQGLSQGAHVMKWALLPTIAYTAMGDPGPLATVLGAAVAATVLRLSASWSKALITVALGAMLFGLSLMAFGQALILAMLEAAQQLLGQLQAPQATGETPQLPSAFQLIGMVSLSNALTVAICLILARWWQALLYNPGGFAAEFQRFRLNPAELILCVGSTLVVWLSFDGAAYWGLLGLVPLLFAGFGLAHGLAKMRGLSGAWLGLFYLSWVMLHPLKLLLMLAVAIDTWVDFRGRRGDAGPPDSTV